MPAKNRGLDGTAPDARDGRRRAGRVRQRQLRPLALESCAARALRGRGRAYLRARTLILSGLTADNCVLFTASDAYLRDFHLIVPDDCVASIDPRHTQRALAHMHRVLKAEVVSSTTLSLSGRVA